MKTFLSIGLCTLLTAAVFCLDVSAQDSAAKMIKSTPFILSEEAVAAGIDGSLTLSFTVTKEGDVKDVMTIAGPQWPCGKSPDTEIERVRKAVEANVETFKFSPAMKDGKARSSEMQLFLVIGDRFKKIMTEAEAEKDPAAKPKIIKAGTMALRAKSFPKPEYPAEARRTRASGAVRVAVLVDEEGNVISAGAVSGPEILQHPSRNAACNAKFSPTILNGTPVKVFGFVIYNYSAY